MYKYAQEKKRNKSCENAVLVKKAKNTGINEKTLMYREFIQRISNDGGIKGHIRTYHENYLLLCGLHMCFYFIHTLCTYGYLHWDVCTKTKIIRKTANFMRCGNLLLYDLWEGLFDGDEGSVLTTPIFDRNLYNITNSRQKLDNDQIIQILEFVDYQHSLGKCVTRKKLFLLLWTNLILLYLKLLFPDIWKNLGTHTEG